MICEFCDGTAISKKATRFHWLDGELYIVENVPTLVCLECGERFFHAKTLDSIDVMLRGEHEVKRHLEVEVVPF